MCAPPRVRMGGQVGQVAALKQDYLVKMPTKRADLTKKMTMPTDPGLWRIHGLSALRRHRHWQQHRHRCTELITEKQRRVQRVELAEAEFKFAT